MPSISTLVDRVQITIISSGTGPFHFGTAVPGYRGIEALSDGATYSYAVQSGARFEAGTLLYQATGALGIRSPQISSNGGAAENFEVNLPCSFTALAAAMNAGAFPIIDALGSATDAAPSQAVVTNALSVLTADVNHLSDLVFELSLQAAVDLTAGQLVNVYNSSGQTLMRLADATDPTKPANGFVQVPTLAGFSGTMSFAGINRNAVPNATFAPVWLSDTTPGAYALAPPSTSGHIVQPIGNIVPGVGLVFLPQPTVLL